MIGKPILLASLGDRLIAISIYLLTFSLPLLHFDKSRVYNYRIAALELLILVAAFVFFRRKLIAHFTGLSIVKLILLFFLCAGFFSALLSDFQKYAYTRYFSIIIWFSYCWLLVFLIRSKRISPSFLLWVALLSCLIPIFTLLYYYFSSEVADIYGLVARLYYYSNIRHFGYHLTAVTIFSFFLILQKKSTILGYSSGALFYIFHLSFLYWTESRQGVIAVLFVTGIILIAYAQNKCNRYVNVGLIIFASAVFLVQILKTEHNLIQSLSFLPATLAEWNHFTSGRVEIWQNTIDILSDHWWFGHGPDSFIFLFPDIIYVHPHSFPLQAVLEWGVVGSFFLLLLIIYLVSLLWRKMTQFKQVPALELAASLLIIGYLVNSLVDGIFYHVLPIYYFSIALAILLAGDNSDSAPLTSR